jgi:hypothetical protein
MFVEFRLARRIRKRSNLTFHVILERFTIALTLACATRVVVEEDIFVPLLRSGLLNPSCFQVHEIYTLVCYSIYSLNYDLQDKSGAATLTQRRLDRHAQRVVLTSCYHCKLKRPLQQRNLHFLNNCNDRRVK